MADSKPGLRKPVFTKVEQLRPGTSGHTLTVKVVNVKMVMQKGRSDGPQSRQMRIAECLVGDETGMIIFTARNDQGIYITALTKLPLDTSFPYCIVTLILSSHNFVVHSCWLDLFFDWRKECSFVIFHGVFTCHVSSVFDTFVGILRLCLDVCYFLYFVCGHVSGALFCQFHGHL